MRCQIGMSGSGEKGNRCESCANSSLLLGSAGYQTTGNTGKGTPACQTYQPGDLPCAVQESSGPRVIGCTNEEKKPVFCLESGFLFGGH